MGSSLYHFATYYLPKISSGSSILGSTIVLGEILHDVLHKGRRLSSVYLVLASVSLGDILNSAAWFLGTWAAPSDLDYLDGTNHGTYETCRLQGFLLTLGGLASILFTSTLAVFYLLMVRYEWTEDTGLSRLQPRVQMVLWIFCLACATLPLIADAYHNGGPVCQIDSYPRHCTPSWQGEDTDCTAGDNAALIRQILTFLTACGCTLANAIIFAIIYKKMHQMEKNVEASVRQQPQVEEGEEKPTNSSSGHMTSTAGLDLEDPSHSQQDQEQAPNSSSSRRKGSYLVAREGMLYILGFGIVFCPWGINVAVYLSTGHWNVPLDRICVVTATLQGVWNAYVFGRQRKLKTWLGRHVAKLLRCRRYCRALVEVWAASEFSRDSSTVEKQQQQAPNKPRDNCSWEQKRSADQCDQEEQDSSTFRMDGSSSTRMVVQWSQPTPVSDLGTSELCDGYSEADQKWEQQTLDDSAPFRPVRIQSVVSVDEKYPSSRSSSSSTRRSRNSSTNGSTKDSAPARPIRTISEVSELESIAEDPEQAQAVAVVSVPLGLESIMEQDDDPKERDVKSKVDRSSSDSAGSRDTAPSFPRRAESELETNNSDHVPRRPLRYTSEVLETSDSSDSEREEEDGLFDD